GEVELAKQGLVGIGVAAPVRRETDPGDALNASGIQRHDLTRERSFAGRGIELKDPGRQFRGVEHKERFPVCVPANEDLSSRPGDRAWLAAVERIEKDPAVRAGRGEVAAVR